MGLEFGHYWTLENSEKKRKKIDERLRGVCHLALIYETQNQIKKKKMSNVFFVVRLTEKYKTKQNK